MAHREPCRVGRLDWLSGFVYRKADRVVVLGPYMADRVALKEVAADRVRTIHVWRRRDEIYPIPRGSNALRKSLGLDDAFVAMYSGNLGLAHSFDEFIEAARRLRDRSDIVFLFAGAGPRLAEVKNAQRLEGLANVRFLDYVPRAQLHVSLSMADVHLISMRPEMTGIVVPGKLYGVMAAGRPAIFVGPRHCESADTIRTAGCGVTVDRGDVEGLVASLTHLAGDPASKGVLHGGRAGPVRLPRGLREEALLRPVARPARGADPRRCRPGTTRTNPAATCGLRTQGRVRRRRRDVLRPESPLTGRARIRPIARRLTLSSVAR